MSGSGRKGSKRSSYASSVSSVESFEGGNWENPLWNGYCAVPYNACYGTCFPCCALASAKTLFDGSDWFFNFCCFSCHCAVVRSYIRQGYEIDGRVGMGDCCCSMLCYPCVVTQLLNEVSTRGPKIISVRSMREGAWLAEDMAEEHQHESDPLDILCTFMTSECEVLNLFSEFTGAPFWFGICHSPCSLFCCCINICQANHLARKSYGIGGVDCFDDCMEPTCSLIAPCYNVIYFYRFSTRLKAEIFSRGRPRNYRWDRGIHDITIAVDDR